MAVLTMPVPVVAPEPSSSRTRLVQQSPLGWLLGWSAIVLVALGPLLLIERGFGLAGPRDAQLWIVPVGLVTGVAILGANARFGPKRKGCALEVSRDRLAYPAGAPGVVQRADVGLIDVLGHPLTGQYVLTLYDRRSGTLGAWQICLAGWKPARLVRLLRAAGYPAARHGDVFDGRFQSQTPGEAPRVARWQT